jgi:hypothetical protein
MHPIIQALTGQSQNVDDPFRPLAFQNKQKRGHLDSYGGARRFPGKG